MEKPDLSQFSEDVVNLVMSYSYMSNEGCAKGSC